MAERETDLQGWAVGNVGDVQTKSTGRVVYGKYVAAAVVVERYEESASDVINELEAARVRYVAAALVVERNIDEEALGIYSSDVEAERGRYVLLAFVIVRYELDADIHTGSDSVFKYASEVEAESER